MSPQQTTALPDFYYFCFGAYEPFVATLGFLGTLFDPVTTHNSQAPWPVNVAPYTVLPRPTFVTLIQLAHVCFIIALINVFILSVVRKYLADKPALQERILTGLFTPLLLGDIAHMSITFWALGDDKWDFASWSPLLWSTFIIGTSLLIPRICWHLGIGRYVDLRDGPFDKSPPQGDVKQQ